MVELTRSASNMLSSAYYEPQPQEDSNHRNDHCRQ